ncbi:LEAF RUST 10 DISEASE-RESISTANCE LOCUS RECEPTOR-LIKE PROTEIN KINASE-like 1.2 isoform X4 [Carica papaya]|uniref:LEAF RUST 10 DISEASE-RESISTANCE LOCUS RECEPTOR-LIKE PROTEIN KINASE-like 1.2 isoform X4 n=1 Tax=Carica papaya TaxID=3649 RepID=UPI000B8CE450|nr:LEAF RUST 10 DISEASE-RESISTANCE LOCUS RECEPTOR-LIKE PROTEIN KINASE-like 1.2 isoform X4 [Carica papaya]
MESHLSQSSILQSLISIFLISITLSPCQCQENEQFLDCSQPFECGTRQGNVGYPFWGNNRPMFCGLEGFEVQCLLNQQIVMDVEDQSFRVLNVDRSLQVVSISRMDLADDVCNPEILLNTTSALNHTRFRFPSDIRNLSLFYGCDEGGSNSLPCESEPARSKHVYYSNEQFPDDSPPNMGSCNLQIIVPIPSSHLRDLFEGTIGLREAMSRGFNVEYVSPNENCSACERSGGFCGSDDDQKFVCFCSGGPQPDKCPGENRVNMKTKVIIGVIATFVGVVLACTGCYLYQRRKKKLRIVRSTLLSRSISADDSSVDVEKGRNLFGIHLFTYAELEEATSYFDSAKELGDGGFGTVYYGKLQDGRAVAVKRLYENNYKRVEQFMNEVEILTRLRHHHLVSLFGCTSRHSRELLLVYEFVPNGTVADHLHGERAKPGALPWPIRLKIAIETAGALTYLHATDIIHRDVKTNNILLDNNFSVKVADFGLSRLFPTDVTHVSTAPQGTPGYVDPEYHQCYQLTEKSDVFSYGVVLIELISSLPAVDITRHRQEINLSTLAINKIQNHALHELVDTSLGFESDSTIREMITAVAEVAFQCLQSEKDMRPSMLEVLESLIRIQSQGYNSGKAEEMDIPAADVVLLKSGPLQLSPESETVNLVSRSTTSNTSS